MEKINLNEYLASNEYPGRGIAVAMAPDGRQMFIGYFIMGRSENSRNRVFDPIPERGGICTMAADPDKLEDPSLIIYNPVLTLGRTQIVTNGDQTDTIYDLMSRGKSFADALRTRTFEPDGPNYTPPHLGGGVRGRQLPDEHPEIGRRQRRQRPALFLRLPAARGR